MADVHFALGGVSAPEKAKEIVAMEAATAIVMRCMEKNIGMFMKSTGDTAADWDYDRMGKFIAAAKRALIA